jgi:hypothetical protein
MCSTFGAHWFYCHHPGLPAGAIHDRPFGPFSEVLQLALRSPIQMQDAADFDKSAGFGCPKPAYRLSNFEGWNIWIQGECC